MLKETNLLHDPVVFGEGKIDDDSIGAKCNCLGDDRPLRVRTIRPGEIVGIGGQDVGERMCDMERRKPRSSQVVPNDGEEGVDLGRGVARVRSRRRPVVFRRMREDGVQKCFANTQVEGLHKIKYAQTISFERAMKYNGADEL